MGESFLHRVEPRYIETDQGGRIHHASFVAWFEEARVAYLTDHGIAYAEVEAQGFILVVRRLDIRYRAAVVFGSPVTIETRVAKLGRASVDFAYALRQSDRICAEAVTELACVGRDGKPTSLPQPLLNHLVSPIK